MAVLSIVLLIIALIFGYSKPRLALWFSIIFFPLLYPANFALVPSTILYTNINRVVLVLLIGIYLKTPKRFNFSILMRNKVIKVFFIFSLYIIVISLGDRLKNLIFTYIPNLIIIIMLGYAIIEQEVDFKKVIRIFVWHAAFFNMIVLLDFFNIINISLIVRELSPTFNEDFVQEGLVRASIYRVAGWDGNSIYSAVRLVILFPIILLNMELSKNKLFSLIIAILTFISIILLMSRAAYIGFIASMLFLFFYMFFKVDKNIITRLVQTIRKSILILGILLTTTIIVPFVNRTVINIYEFSFSTKIYDDNENRLYRIPYALDRIMEKPIFGWGSPQYAYYEVMNTDDVPLPILYLIAGGVPLFILFMFWWVKMPFYFIKYIKYNFANKKDKLIFIYVGSSMVGGLIPVLSNLNNKSLLLTILIFIITYKYSLIRFNLGKSGNIRTPNQCV